jgi:hypothetical protein
LAKPITLQLGEQLEQEMRNPFERPLPSKIDQMFGLHRRLAGKGPENRGREPRVTFEEAEKLRKWDGRDDAIGQRGDRIEGMLEKAAGKADEVSRKAEVSRKVMFRTCRRRSCKTR